MNQHTDGEAEMTTLKQELQRYSEIKTASYIRKGFQGNGLKAAVEFAVMDMINELNSYATDKVAYLKAENDDLKKLINIGE